MDKVVEEICYAIYNVSVDRIENGFILETPLDQIQDALDIIRLESEGDASNDGSMIADVEEPEQEGGVVLQLFPNK
tara:strand:+ start:2752 stop:2979 length:228 start_codon:yes stop_codon:yes gene_type:complete